MKIIYWEKKGNVVRFYLGENALKDWGGDDWSNTPYEHNAGDLLYGADATVDVAFNFDVTVHEAKDDPAYKGNSPFSMNDFKARKVPLLIIDKSEYPRHYSKCLKSKDCFPIYMGDSCNDTLIKLYDVIMGVSCLC